jgi:hypothetical protein
LVGCPGERSRTTAKGLPAGVVDASRVDPASGNLIALWMQGEGANSKREPVLVTKPYAMFVYWPHPEYEKNADHKKVFLFYDNVAKKTYQSRDFDAFLKVMAEQPRDISVTRIDSCTVSRWNLPGDERGRLDKVMAEGNRKWADNPDNPDRIIFCYCKYSDDFLYPGDVR